MDNEDSVTYRQFRSAVRHVKILVKKLQPDADEEFRPDARDLMQAMARLSETAKAFYDTHRGHQYSDKGKDRRMACDMVRQLTRDFYDKMDAAMGGKGYENIVTKKKPEEKGVDHRIVSADKMKELVSVYGKWKKHFALQEGLERSKIRDRAKLFEPYERYIEMYKDTHRTKEWPKEIEEVIRDAASYRVQNRVFETYEKEKNGIDDPVLALAKKHADTITGRQKPEEKFDSKEIDAKLSDKQLKALDSIDRWFLRNYNNGGTVGTLINVKNHHGEIVSELFSKTKRERLFIYYLIETRQRKNPGVFDVFSSQSYIPDLERFKDRMLASKFKVMSRIMGGYTYMGKVTESMQVNRDYRSLIKDVAKLDRGVKEVKGKELEELKKKKEEYRTYALARTSQSTKAFRDEAIRVGELGKKATKKDRDSLQEELIACEIREPENENEPEILMVVLDGIGESGDMEGGIGEFFFAPPSSENDTIQHFCAVLSLLDDPDREYLPQLFEVMSYINFKLPCGSYSVDRDASLLCYRLTSPIPMELSGEGLFEQMNATMANALTVADLYVDTLIKIAGGEKELKDVIGSL
ncbi:MAG: YbjN domain-containing protein [Lachnospiraceae bacterium]|nr:YbjN domain-containing protein [Lachnospiraceae bacterium]